MENNQDRSTNIEHNTNPLAHANTTPSPLPTNPLSHGHTNTTHNTYPFSSTRVLPRPSPPKEITAITLTSYRTFPLSPPFRARRTINSPQPQKGTLNLPLNTKRNLTNIHPQLDIHHTYYPTQKPNLDLTLNPAHDTLVTTVHNMY